MDFSHFIIRFPIFYFRARHLTAIVYKTTFKVVLRDKCSQMNGSNIHGIE